MSCRCEPAKDQPGAKGEEAAKVEACTCKCKSEDEHDDDCKCICDQCVEEDDAPILGGFDPNSSTKSSAKKPDEELTERERSGINEWQGVALKDLKGQMGAQIASRVVACCHLCPQITNVASDLRTVRCRWEWGARF